MTKTIKDYVVGDFPIAGVAQIDVAKVKNDWDSGFTLSFFNGLDPRFLHLDTDIRVRKWRLFSEVHSCVEISESQANELIRDLNLKKEQSPILNNLFTYQNSSK